MGCPGEALGANYDAGIGLYSPGGQVVLQTSRDVSYLSLSDKNETARASLRFRSPGGPSYLEGPRPSYLMLVDADGKTLFKARGGSNAGLNSVSCSGSSLIVACRTAPVDHRPGCSRRGPHRQSHVPVGLHPPGTAAGRQP